MTEMMSDSHASPETADSGWVGKASFTALIALLIWAPLAFGTTEQWSLFIQRTVSIGLFALWVASRSREGFADLFPQSISLPVLGFAAMVLFQLISGMTAYRYATLAESLNLIAYASMMLIAADVFVFRKRLRTFGYSVAIYGSALALFSIVQGLSGTNNIYWFRPVESISAAIYGPYANHNHYAGLMEMLIPLGFASTLLVRGPKQGLLFFGTALMVLSVGLSRSRSGVISLGAEIVFVCVMLCLKRRDRRRLPAFLTVAALIGIIVLLLGSDKISERLSEAQDSYRLKIYSDSLRMAADKPLLGYGLGTFPYVYPAHRTFHTNLFVNHAHNDYLELLVDTGIVGLGLFVWMLAGVFHLGMSKMARHDGEGSLLTLACLSGITGIMVHSLLDFNLHIPANAALFLVLCAAVATPFRNRKRSWRFQHCEGTASGVR